MRLTIIHYILGISLLTNLPNVLLAQDLKGGKIIYEQVVDYELEGAYDEPIWEDYIANIPKSGKSFHMLSFTREHSFYAEDLSRKEKPHQELSKAIMKANYYKAPQAKINQIYYDFAKKEKIEQLTFMTRAFLVESATETHNWKLNNRRKKIMDYVCMGADLQLDGETLTAWFTPQIPISIGPSNYHGLPGVILGLEKEEQVFLLATSVQLEAPEGKLIEQLANGQPYKSAAFAEVVQQKQKEFLKMRETEKNEVKKSKY
ncbi:MAG: GLPGLI family protein [Bacteroidota bacterium]